ncbi:MAG TPA: sulfatase [Bryobacteraceae bacterium]|nr:sulfatase [Bryobacteraceae bacterium]
MTTSRRDWLRRTAALAAVPGIAEHHGTRPNILFALADDWGWPSASIAADPVVKTPVFDRVARSGVLFTNAFVSAPSCTPSRAAMLTGQQHWRLEEGANLGGTLPARFPVYPDLLEAAGYHVGFTRKGWAPGDEAPGGRKRNPAGPRYQDLNAFLSARPKGAPFCFWFGSTDPHRPYDRDSGAAAGIRWQDVRVPPYLPDHETVRRDIADHLLEVQRFDRETGESLATIEKAGELDNTIVVMSGDNGWPFPRAKATLYDSGTHVPLAISWPSRVAGGRRVEDFVSLADLAPTFLEAAGIRPPSLMTARSLMPILTAKQAGRVDPRRDHVLTGMERHVPSRGEIRGGYPMRAIRTRDFLYIRNFKPDRWPSGDPNGLEDGAQPFSFDELATQTFSTLADIDSGPSKAYLVTHRNEPGVEPLYARAAGKRPGRELYDLRKDPFEMNNVAAETSYADTVKRLDAKLMTELEAGGDPRARGGGEEFDRYIWYQGRRAGKK